MISDGALIIGNDKFTLFFLYLLHKFDISLLNSRHKKSTCIRQLLCRYIFIEYSRYSLSKLIPFFINREDSSNNYTWKK